MAGTTVFYLPRLLDRGDAVLIRLLTGWDHAATYAHVQAIRKAGILPGGTASDALSPITQGHYPVGPHSLIASLVNTSIGSSDTDWLPSITAFNQAIAIASIASAVMVLASVLMLETIARSWLRSMVAAFAVTFLFTWGPAGAQTVQGFTPFLVATSLVATTVLWASNFLARPSGISLLTLTIGMVGVAHGWTLLLLFLLPAWAIVALRLARQTGLARKLALWVAASITLGTVGVLRAVVPLLKSMSIDRQFLMGWGGIRADSLLTIAVTCIVSIIASAGAAFTSRKSDLASRVLTLATISFATIFILAFGYRQYRALGTFYYYFWKSATSVEILCTVLAVSLLAFSRWQTLAVMALLPLTVFGSKLQPLGLSEWRGSPFRELGSQVSKTQLLKKPESPTWRLIVPSSPSSSADIDRANLWLLAQDETWLYSSREAFYTALGRSTERTSPTETIRAFLTIENTIILTSPDIAKKFQDNPRVQAWGES